ncbi:MAG: hypothetical protein RMY30_005340 [Nostoc sp. CmiSLP01]|nr:hypothetical protein [Nostoc sp. CmiSLP01]MDZ8289515.1 hypothetical protein [Nostoc sp. ChiSLP01]
MDKQIVFMDKAIAFMTNIVILVTTRRLFTSANVYNGLHLRNIYSIVLS